MSPAEASSRARVTALAREWIGTPYRHGARLKGIGCDCTFVACVYEAAGLVPHLDIAPYTPQAHLHREGSLYLDLVLRHGRRTDAPLPGDMALYRYGRAFSHGAIVVEPGWPAVVHGDMGARCVIEAVGDQGRLAVMPPPARADGCARERMFCTLWRAG